MNFDHKACHIECRNLNWISGEKSVCSLKCAIFISPCSHSFFSFSPNDIQTMKFAIRNMWISQMLRSHSNEIFGRGRKESSQMPITQQFNKYAERNVHIVSIWLNSPSYLFRFPFYFLFFCWLLMDAHIHAQSLHVSRPNRYAIPLLSQENGCTQKRAHYSNVLSIKWIVYYRWLRDCNLRNYLETITSIRHWLKKQPEARLTEREKWREKNVEKGCREGKAFQCFHLLSLCKNVVFAFLLQLLRAVSVATTFFHSCLIAYQFGWVHILYARNTQSERKKDRNHFAELFVCACRSSHRKGAAKKAERDVTFSSLQHGCFHC